MVSLLSSTWPSFNDLQEDYLKCCDPYYCYTYWRPPSMHCLLSFTFVTFLIVWPLSPAASSVSWYRSCLVWSGLAYEIYSGGGRSTYVYCVVCYRVIVAPYVRSVGHVFAYLYTLDDDSERPMDYVTSLLPKVFPYYCGIFIWKTFGKMVIQTLDPLQLSRALTIQLKVKLLTWSLIV